MLVRYTNTSNERILERETFDRLGLDLDEKYGEGLVWNDQNHHTLELPDEAAQKLVELMPDEFKVLDRDDEVPDEPDSSSSSSQGEEKPAPA